MTISKQDFYEGAALHALARTGRITSISYDPPFFVFNNDILVTLKYCTRGRSPWGFTFTAAEQELLQARASKFTTMIALICGADGIAAFAYPAYLTIASPRRSAVHIACYRKHGEHYEVNGPDGRIHPKVAPSDWKRILASTEGTTS
jgi:hypothetical protein